MPSFSMDSPTILAKTSGSIIIINIINKHYIITTLTVTNTTLHCVFLQLFHAVAGNECLAEVPLGPQDAVLLGHSQRFS